MNTIQLNIGLNNNPMSSEEVMKYLENNTIAGIGGTLEGRIAQGEYLGEVERTLVVRFKSVQDKDLLLHFVKSLCHKLTQDCIALKLDDEGQLVFNPNYDGLMYDFDEKYFINY